MYMHAARTSAMFTFGVALFLAIRLPAQVYLKKGETLVCSFKTQHGKRLTVATGADDSYIVYRFGTDKKIELEYPTPKDSTSWKKMFFTWHMHPSMGEDDGTDYDCLNFINGKYRYIIYDSRYGDKEYIGVKVLDLDDKVIADFPAIKSTHKGTLMNLRGDDRLGKGQEY